jgi:alpha-mannosidase
MNERCITSGMKWKVFGCIVSTIFLATIFASNSVKAERAQDTSASVSDKALRLVSVEPTVLFVREKGAVLQVAEVAVDNTSEAVQASIDVKIDSAQRSTALGEVKKGKTTFAVHVPDIVEPTLVEFVLKSDGKVRDSRKITWQRQRRWRVYIVPITHHDLGYTDTIENVLRRYDSFYDDVIRFCEETEDWPEESKYRYAAEGTWSVQHFIENRPKDVTDKLGKYIKEGRIEIGALFGNEISALCSHEQLIRLMYPSFRLKREYGAQILTGSITDVPGLSWGLPTVLAGAGVRYFFAGLPTYFEWGRSDIHTFWDESAILRHGRPDAFRWQGPDGQTVLVYYQGSYGFFKRVTGPDSYEEVMSNLPGMLKTMENQDTPFSVMRYIHNGVDNFPPDVKISHIAREWNSKWAYPKLIVATNSMFFEELEKQCEDVRTFRGELPQTDYVVGAISTAKETSINRVTHDRLHSAEKSATIASLISDYHYPAEEIREAYDNVLLYDEHTWGRAYPAGEGQDWAWNEKSHYAYKAAGLAESILRGSLEAIASNIKLDKQGRHVIVFNALSVNRTDVVRVARFRVKEPFDLVDEGTGRKVPYQIVELDSPLAPVPYAAHRYGRGQFEGHELFELVFVAEDVPPVGYKTYWISQREKAAPFSSSLMVGDKSLENRFFKVTLDPQTGTVASIYDKELSREIVDEAAPHKLNQLVPRWVQSGKQESPKKGNIRKGQAGPVYGSLIVRSEGAGCPQLTQEVILYDNIKRIDFANRVLKDSTPLLEIYFAFPFKMENPDFRFEGSNSVIKPLRDQFPGSNSNYYAVQHWADVSDGKVGVTLSGIESHLLEFGGLWPCYVSQAHHGVTPPDFGREFVKPGEVTKGHMYAFVIDSNFRTNFQPVQQGDILFRYCVTTHAGDCKEGRPRDFGWAAGNPLIGVVVNGKREGTLEKRASFCQVDKSNVFLLTLKRAEDGAGIIVRLIETEGKEVTATLTVPHLTIERAHRTNLVEENEAEITCTGHEIKVPLKAFGITTIRIELL